MMIVSKSRCYIAKKTANFTENYNANYLHSDVAISASDSNTVPRTHVSLIIRSFCHEIKIIKSQRMELAGTLMAETSLVIST